MKRRGFLSALAVLPLAGALRPALPAAVTPVTVEPPVATLSDNLTITTSTASPLTLTTTGTTGYFVFAHAFGDYDPSWGREMLFDQGPMMAQSLENELARPVH